jgi:hypothetical protein
MLVSVLEVELNSLHTDGNVDVNVITLIWKYRVSKRFENHLAAYFRDVDVDILVGILLQAFSIVRVSESLLNQSIK